MHSTVSGREDSQRWLFSSLVRLTLPGRLRCFLENRDENQTHDAFVLISLGKYSACEQKDDPKHKSGRITEICMWLEEGQAVGEREGTPVPSEVIGLPNNALLLYRK